MIRFDNVSVTYRTDDRTHEAIEGINLDLAAGNTCALIGPTGCGKTTLLFLLAGLLEPTSGEVTVNGERLSSPRSRTSLILQQHGLFPWKNAYDNVSLGLKIRGADRLLRRERSRSLMQDLGIWDVRRSHPPQLSGGQRQRVAIARSLATEPDLLLMDEPFSALDAITRESLQALLLQIWKERDLTFVLVTHSIEEAVFLGGRIAVLSRRPGRLVTVLENPEMGEASYRLSETFHARCTEIRKIMETPT